MLAANIKPDMDVVMKRFVRRKWYPVVLHQEIPDTQLVALPNTSGNTPGGMFGERIGPVWNWAFICH